LDTLAAASSSVLDAEVLRLDQELRTMTFKRNLLAAELARRA
jgi:hypothetical protein